MLSARKVLLQVIAWLVGLALLAWVIKGAIEKGSGSGAAEHAPSAWERIRAAPPLLIVALLGCTLASAMFNGTTFWITVQPLRPVRWLHMQLLNLVANMLNYAPVRLGAIARIAYHMRVDRLSLLQIGGWFALVAYVLALGIGSALMATLLRPAGIDWVWLAIVVGQMIVGGAALRFIASIPLIARHARGLDRMALHSRGLWGAIVLRVFDLSAYVGRMGAAMMLLGMHLPWSHVIVLAMVALAASLIPFGRVGFREFCVAAAAARLSMEATTIDAAFKQLALLESAGEALVFIPLGIAALPWYRLRWRSAAIEPNATVPPSTSGPAPA
jgi:hypothetical protein